MEAAEVPKFGLREEVLAILAARFGEVGLAPPVLGLQWIPGFLTTVARECRAHAVTAPCPVFGEEPEEPARRAGLKLINCSLPLRCGGSTAHALHLPWHRDRATRRLTIVHELLHAIGLRRELLLNEADWWLCTAAFVHQAVKAGRGLRYPTWFVGAIPREIVVLLS